MGRNPTDKTVVFLPLATPVAEATVTIGTNESLTDHFTEAEVDESDFAYFSPQSATLWIKFKGGIPAANDGHPVAEGTTRETNQNESLDLLKMTGTGACTITLWKYS